MITWQCTSKLVLFWANQICIDGWETFSVDTFAPSGPTCSSLVGLLWKKQCYIHREKAISMTSEYLIIQIRSSKFSAHINAVKAPTKTEHQNKHWIIFFSCPILISSSPLCGDLTLSGSLLILATSQLLRRRLSVIADDVLGCSVFGCRVA